MSRITEKANRLLVPLLCELIATRLNPVRRFSQNKLFEPRLLGLVNEFLGPRYPEFPIAFKIAVNEKEGKVFISSHRGDIWVYDMKGNSLRLLGEYSTRLTSMCVTQTGRLLVVATESDAIVEIDPDTGESAIFFQYQKHEVVGIWGGTDCVYAYQSNNILSLIDEKGNLTKTVIIPDEELKDMRISPTNIGIDDEKKQIYVGMVEKDFGCLSQINLFDFDGVWQSMIKIEQPNFYKIICKNQELILVGSAEIIKFYENTIRTNPVNDIISVINDCYLCNSGHLLIARYFHQIYVVKL